MFSPGVTHGSSALQEPEQALPYRTDRRRRRAVRVSLAATVVGALALTSACVSTQPHASTGSPLAACDTVSQSVASSPSNLGAVYQLPLDLKTTPVIHATGPAVDCGPPLIEADNPEAVSTPGISAEASVQGGSFEFFYYQRTASPTPLYFLPALINHSGSAVTVVITREGTSVGPIAAETNMAFEFDYLNAIIHRQVIVPPHGWAWFDPSLTQTPTVSGHLAVGQFELTANGPVTAAMVATGNPSTANPLTMSVLAPENNGAGRGIFPNSDREMTFQVQSYPSVFVLSADHYHPRSRALDPYVQGTDPTTGLPTQDTGNYGILYHVHIALHGTPHEVIGVFLSAATPGAAIGDAEQFRDGNALQLPATGTATSIPNAGILMTEVTLDSAGNGQAYFRLFPPSGLAAITHITVMPVSGAQLLFTGFNLG